MRNLTEKQKSLYDEIRDVWKESGWSWDSHAGEAAKKLAPVICSIIERELSEFQTLIEATRKVVDVQENKIFISDRAKDALQLYKELKRAGMSEDGCSYAVYAFLIGDSASCQSKTDSVLSHIPLIGKHNDDIHQRF